MRTLVVGGGGDAGRRNREWARKTVEQEKEKERKWKGGGCAALALLPNTRSHFAVLQRTLAVHVLARAEIDVDAPPMDKHGLRPLMTSKCKPESGACTLKL